MELLGVGPAELLFILILALILIGPRDMAKTGRTIGSWLNHFVRSDTYKVIQKTGSEIRGLPTTLMREANLEEAKQEMERWKQDVNEIGGGREIRQALATSFDEKKIWSELAASPDEQAKPADEEQTSSAPGEVGAA